MFFQIFTTTCLFFSAVWAVNFTIQPSTFVPGVTPSVLLRCHVDQSAAEISQLLVIQIATVNGETETPLVFLTPGQQPRIMQGNLSSRMQVNGVAEAFTDISSDYLSVTYPNPATDLANNYSCSVSGLRSNGLLYRVKDQQHLSLGAVDLLPRFMTQHAVQLRTTINNLKTQRDLLKDQLVQLRETNANITKDLLTVEQNFTTLLAQLNTLKTRANGLMLLLADATTHFTDLSNRRPSTKVSFHAALSNLGARTVVLNTPIVFDHLVINEGQGYDTATGIFRAPEEGTYLLTASVEAGAGGRWAEVSIKKNGIILQTMQVADDTGYEHSTTTTIAQLESGAQVTCEVTWFYENPGYVGSTLAAAPYVTSFSGYIIW